jgi:endonuclease YncB( thermonuclease family)
MVAAVRHAKLSITLLAAWLAYGCASSPPAAPPPPANPFDHVVFHNCQEGNVCVMTLLGLPTVFGDHLTVQLHDIDTPKMNGPCEKERLLARRAQTATEGLLGQAQRIQLQQPRRDQLFRLHAVVIADGRDVGATLVERGLATRRQEGRGKGWCTEEP